MTHWTRMSAIVMLITLIGLAAGCDEPSPTKLVVDEQALNNAHTEMLPNAEEPQPEDYVYSAGPTVIAADDVLDISILDLYQPGTETTLRREIEPDGTIDLPLLTDRITAAGLTVDELADVISDRYDETDVKPSAVAVAFVTRGQQAFTIQGSVLNPGTYQHLRPGFRLMDAIALARGMTSPTIKYIYVIRPTLGDAHDARVIGIDLRRLFDGDETQNILIRPDDIIHVPLLERGEYEIRGDVSRPGVYSLTSRRITVKMVIAAAGNFGTGAWPEHAILVRPSASGQDQVIHINVEKIVTGEESDLYVKNRDLIVVY